MLSLRDPQANIAICIEPAKHHLAVEGRKIRRESGRLTKKPAPISACYAGQFVGTRSGPV